MDVKQAVAAVAMLGASARPTYRTHYRRKLGLADGGGHVSRETLNMPSGTSIGPRRRARRAKRKSVMRARKRRGW